MGKEVQVGKMDSLWHKFGVGETGSRYHNGILLNSIGSFKDGTAGTLNGRSRYDRGFYCCIVGQF